MSDQQRLFADEDQDSALRCPSCGDCPRERIAAKSPGEMRPGEFPPDTREGDLDYFDVGGADEGNVFCNHCGAEFNPDTGVIAADWDGDD